MSTTPSEPRSGRSRMMRVYGPLAAIVVVAIIVVVVIAATSGGSNSKSSTSTSGAASADDPAAMSQRQLVLAGPMTPAKAKLLGKTVDFGPNCDTQRGTVAIPTVYAAPCVQPFSGDNGGATAPGVTGDSITIVDYIGNPQNDPLQSALISGTGANISVDAQWQTMQGYVQLYTQHYELYGRKINLVKFVGTGSALDEVKAKADAIAIASMNPKPFAVIGGPSETNAFLEQLAAEHILCVGTCAVAPPEAVVQQDVPYVWPVGPSPEQGSLLSAAVICKQFQGDAVYAGDAAMHSKPRVFGIAHYDTATGEQRQAYDVLVQNLAKCGIHPKTDVDFQLNPAALQDTARTIISKFKDAGVTTVLYTGDPLTPIYLSKEATAQNWYPEWMIGENVYVDTATFARQYDQKQWAHAFGFSLNAARGTQATSNGYHLYQWQFGKPPPTNIYDVVNSSPQMLFAGLTLAGPDLTPQTFEAGLFRAGVVAGGPTRPQVSWGHHDVWPNLDLNGTDDATLIWWNPEPVGQDEAGTVGKGLYEYPDNGKRFTLANVPSQPVKLFDPSNSVTIFQTLPPSDQVPNYPSPAGAPGSGG